MFRMLDIDMDFFLNKIAVEKDSDIRLNSNEYTPWSEKDFRIFLEEKCKLAKASKIPGKIIKNHVEAFYFWENLISKEIVESSFEVTHIDAHTDLKAGWENKGMEYILNELLHIPINKRLKNLDRSKMGSANYLSFAIACGFFSKVDFVVHPEFDYEDMPALFFKELNIYSDKLEMKAYTKEDMSYGRFKFPAKKDQEIPFQIVRPEEFQSHVPYDYLVFCQSPGYTPESADFMLEVIKEYIMEC